MKSSMKKLLALFVCVCLLMSGTAYAQEDGTEKNDGNGSTGSVVINETNFPDKNFREYVKQRFDKDDDGELSEEEIKDVDEIDVMGQEVSDLKGIEYFTSLTSLNCFENELKSLDVRANTKLQVLCCGGNQLKSLDVRANVELTELDCSYNELTSLDVSANTKLIGLFCSSNQLAVLDVKANTALTDLVCGDNQLASLDVSANTKLKELYCYENQLESLDIRNNVALTKLDCYANQLKALNVSNNVNLVELFCSVNELTTLDVSNNQNLIEIDCGINQLQKLDVSKNMDLTELDCSENELVSLDVSKNVKLIRLWCEANSLTALDVSKNGELVKLDCIMNNLTALDVSKNINLTGLFCDVNKLTTLDVSQNVNLTSLTCGDNPLETLDVRNCTELSYLDIRPLAKGIVQCSNEPIIFLYSDLPNAEPGIDISAKINANEVKAKANGIDGDAIYRAFNVDLDADARVIVEQKEPNSASQNFIINHVNGFGDEILKVYDVVMNLHIDGQDDAIPITDNFGKLTLSFYAGTEYAGKTVTIYQLHENADGTSEVITYKNLTVGQDGMVEITVDKLSTFGLSLQNTTVQTPAGSTTDANNRPNTLTASNGNTGDNGSNAGNNANDSDNTADNAAQTGDSANMTVWVALMMLTMTIIPIVAILGRRQKR